MKINSKGLELIKSFEGCRLTAYKPVKAEKFWTIGYGHYGADVTQGMTITQAQAEQLLKQDLAKFEGYVEKYVSIPLTENQFSALVSFTYNCGAGNLQKLVRNRNTAQIAEAILLYNKASGKVLNGLVRRRKAERELFLSDGVTGNPYSEPTNNIKRGSRGNGVKWVQWELNQSGYNLSVDGIAGSKTDSAIRDFQSKNKLVVDGICGKNTRAKLKEDL